MKVYRYLSEEELKNILDGNIKDIGYVSKTGDSRSNNFHYRTDNKYLHFYKHKEDMNRIKDVYKNYDKKFYFACFDIPKPFLIIGFGHGTYYSQSGYDNPYETVREFIVNTKHFKKEWLLNYKKDETKQINNIPEF